MLNANLISKTIGLKSPSKEVSLNELKTLTKNLFKFDRRLNIIIGNELNSLREILKETEDFDWKPLNLLIEGKDHTGIDERNFLAHAGFERNAVEVKKENGKIFVRYRKELLGEKAIYKFCQSGLLYISKE